MGAGNSVNFTNKSVNGTGYNWSFGDGQTSTSVNPTHTYNDTGAYVVRLITAKSGCSDTAYSKVYVGTSSIRQSIENTGMIISPNPVMNELRISSRLFLSDNYYVIITNVYGQVVHSHSATQQEQQGIDVSDLANGLYFLTVSSGVEAVYSGRFVKQ